MPLRKAIISAYTLNIHDNTNTNSKVTEGITQSPHVSLPFNFPTPAARLQGRTP